jgi:hypothetical protein
MPIHTAAAPGDEERARGDAARVVFDVENIGVAVPGAVENRRKGGEELGEAHGERGLYQPHKRRIVLKRV